MISLVKKWSCNLWMFFLFGMLISLNNRVSAQPFYPTYTVNRIAGQNSFVGMEADKSVPPKFSDCRTKLPQPYWKGRHNVIDCYWRAWEIAFSNLKSIETGSGFVSPYIDPAFNGNIFMWDCSFMTMFGKYAKQVFDFQGTLNNFYGKQHTDGFICREIREIDGTDVFASYDPSSTGPNIMPWAEWEYFQNFNDTARLSKVLPVLLGYYRWFRDNRSWPDRSYYSTGWGCGMDNQPRIPERLSPEFSHGFMSWIDINLQQILAGKLLLKMDSALNGRRELKDIKEDVMYLESYVNGKMWNEYQHYYFDRYRDGTLSNLKSIASYWALLAGIVPEKRMLPFISHLKDTSEFSRLHRVSTLAANDRHFNPDGGYWNGSVWAPTNYMVLRGLTNCHQDSLAYEIAINHLNALVQVYDSTKDLRENYAPDKIQGNGKHNFVGWTGLTPINVLLEYVFGIRANVPEKTLLIDVRLLDEYGVRQYPFGREGVLSISNKKRRYRNERPSIQIDSNIPLKVIVQWPGGRIVQNILKGRNIL